MRRPLNGFFPFYTVIILLNIFPFIYTYKKAIVEPEFEEWQLWGLHYNHWLITSQTSGLILGKVIRRVIAEEAATVSSGWTILLMIGIASFSLLLLTLVPVPYKIPFLFTSGISLGIIWISSFGKQERLRTVNVR